MKAELFGEYLKNLRKQKKLTIRQLDIYSGVSHSYLSQLENGKRGIPTPEILKKLHGPLDVSYEELMMAAGYLDYEANTKVGVIKEKPASEEYHKIERFARKVSQKDLQKALTILEAAFEEAFNEEDDDDDDF